MSADGSQIKLIFFDVDGTLIHHEDHRTVWQVLNRRFLQHPELNRERFEAFRSGRITYAEWVDLDVGDWLARGVRRTQLVDAIEAELRAAPRAIETVRELARRGYRLIVLSGTIDLTIDLLLERDPFERIFSNRIFFDPEGQIRGWKATRFDVTGKALAIESYARAAGFESRHCAFIGDGWNDIAALRHAGLGIAIHPKEEAVRQAADLVIEDGSLERLLDLFAGTT